MAVARGGVVGFLRALTDGHITLYVAELVAQWRGQYKQRRALQEELDEAFSR